MELVAQLICFCFIAENGAIFKNKQNASLIKKQNRWPIWLFDLLPSFLVSSRLVFLTSWHAPQVKNALLLPNRASFKSICSSFLHSLNPKPQTYNQVTLRATHQVPSFTHSFPLQNRSDVFLLVFQSAATSLQKTFLASESNLSALTDVFRFDHQKKQSTPFSEWCAQQVSF